MSYISAEIYCHELESKVKRAQALGALSLPSRREAPTFPVAIG